MKTPNYLKNSQVAAIVLAAGKGTRMHAGKDRNKVAYPIAGRPMISYSIKHLQEAGVKEIVVVVGHAANSVKDAVGPTVAYATQVKRLGTGHAVMTGLKVVSSAPQTIITLYGDDSAFYPPDLYQQLLQTHLHHQAALSLLTVNRTNPFGLGRIIRNSQGKMVAIVEEKNATLEQRKIKEINTGLFCFERKFLEWGLSRVKKNPLSHEYYLVDLVSIAVKAGYPVQTINWSDDQVWQGVNTLSDLTAIEQKVKTDLKLT